MANGDVYVGEFSSNKINGKGTYTWSDGSKFTGAFVDGQISGEGEI
jgi:hypothetical protein